MSHDSEKAGSQRPMTRDDQIILLQREVDYYTSQNRHEWGTLSLAPVKSLLVERGARDAEIKALREALKKQDEALRIFGACSLPSDCSGVNMIEKARRLMKEAALHSPTPKP